MEDDFNFNAALLSLFNNNQYDIGRRGCALMSSLPKANWDRQAGRRPVISKSRDACASKN